MLAIHHLGPAVAFAAFTLWPCLALAEGSGPTCPEKIETEQSLSKPVEGFEASRQDLPHWWDAIVFYDGRPEEMAALVYDDDVETADGKEVQTWNLDPKSEYWIRCQYSSTSISLIRKLPPVSRCTVTFDKNEKTLALVCR
ncbi:STY0301 family protein [Dongia sp. agr-C8]